MTSEFLDRHSRNFDEHFAFGTDDVALVLKAHLLAEEMCRDFCDNAVPRPEALRKARLSFSQIVRLAESLVPTFSVALPIGEFLWPALHKLNRIRNLMAHALVPDPNELGKNLTSLQSSIEARLSDETPATLNQCLQYLLGALSAYLFVCLEMQTESSKMDLLPGDD